MPEFCEVCGTLLKGKSYCPNCGENREGGSGRGFQGSVEDSASLESKNTGLFPFQKIRSGQEEFMEDSETAFKNGSSLIAHAPTGIGKTAAVLPAAVKAKEEDEKVFFLTSKQSQHRIAIETIKKMPSSVTAIDVISKRHMCPREESRLPYPVFEKFCSENGQNQCNLFNKQMARVVNKLAGSTRHVHQIIELCEQNNVCPHKAALSAGKHADVIVCDYNYIFSDIRERIFDLLELDLQNAIVIVDEAHNLPDRIRSNLRESISLTGLHDSFKLLQGYSSSLASFVKRLASEVRNIDRKEGRISKGFLDKKIEKAMKGGLTQYDSLEDLLGQLENVARDIMENNSSSTAPMHLCSFLSDWKTEGKEVFRAYEPDPPKFRVGLLDPAKMSQDVFKEIKASVLMSGTLHPGEMYADLLGIDDVTIETYESPFPDENRRIVSVGHVTTSYKERGLKMFQAYANSIADVVNNTPGNVAAFFPSYDLMNKVLDRLTMVHLEKEIVAEEREYTKRDKEKMVDSLRRFNDRLLLGVQGGSLSEGVDYANNILSSVIIVGIPFPPPSLKMEALQEYYTEKFEEKRGYEYTRVYPAMNRVLQAAGRCIRSKTDKGLIVLMDKRFNYKRYKKAIPDDFDYRKTNSLVKECEDFFD